uniref:Uncharacterized protein n=1 Tax=viral metagenome TaxID=1070528 RepID=A0A6M3KYA7_9ZZZZ
MTKKEFLDKWGTTLFYKEIKEVLKLDLEELLKCQCTNTDVYDADTLKRLNNVLQMLQ